MILADNFIEFMNKFKENLSKTFDDCDMNSWDYWVNLSGTNGWVESLKDASENRMPEVFALWDKLDWWSSDLLDSWLIDCASYLCLCEKDEDDGIEVTEYDKCFDCAWLNEGSYEDD